MGIAVVVVLCLLALLVVVRLVLAWLEAARRPGRLPPVPFRDTFPAAPVVRTRGVVVAATAAIAWAVLHLGAISYWLATGALLPREFAWVYCGLYAIGCAVITGSGGAAMLGGIAFGRKMIAWGTFCLLIVTYMAMVGSFIVPTRPGAPVRLRELGYPLAVVLAVHLVLDGALGISAHRVGRPEGWSELAAAEEALEPMVLPPAGLSEQFPGLGEPPHARPPGLP